MTDGLLARISDTVTTAKSVEQLTRPMLELLEFVTGLESTYLTRIDSEANVQSILFSRNTKSMVIPEGLTVPWGDTLCKRALDEGRPYTDDVGACWGDSDAARALGIQTYASTPVRLDDGSVYGTLCAASSTRKGFTAEGEQTIKLFATLIGQQIQREQLMDSLQRANSTLEAYSVTDPLTGLPNRRSVTGEMALRFGLAGRARQGVLVAFIDLDGFKKINDEHGHDAGDEFLIEVGRRLQAGMRSGDLCARLGGDEFVVVGMGSPAGEREGVAAAAAMRARLTPLLRGRYELKACSFDYAGASVGIVHADPAHTTPDQALRAADVAMYADKAARRAAAAARH